MEQTKIITNAYGLEFHHGDIFEVNQTINGHSRFVILWHEDHVPVHESAGVHELLMHIQHDPGYIIRYMESNGTLGREYEYDEAELLDIRNCPNKNKRIVLIANIAKQLKGGF